MALTDHQRKLIHDLALDTRDLLTNEARELLEGTYGLYPNGRLEPPEKLPSVQADPEIAETYRRLESWLRDEESAGLDRPEVVGKLVKEVAFTHLNRLVAFKMMEARKLIRGTLDKGSDSNAFKFYLADAEHAEDYALYQAGEVDTAYRRFLLWQSGQIATEIRVLFDPDTLPSRLFPRPRALNLLLEILNSPDVADVWNADETIGWIYQFFNEREKTDVFERLYKQKQKIRRQDIPAATQLFTPNWIVRFLVQNTLGRLWVQMHPDSNLIGSLLLDYLVPLQGEVPPEPLRPIKEITLLDPACGTMHFGLVAFDLFCAMYQEELERAGEPGWPQEPSASDVEEVPAATIAHNLYGIDIDLRAVQLSALALYLKAKTLNPKGTITDSNLVCADVTPLNGAKLGTFLREARFSRPIYERLMRALWARLQDADQLGSLLRLERELGELIAQERARYEQEPLFAGLPGEYEREAAEEEFWGIISAQIIQGLDHFVREQAEAGTDLTFFAGEAAKGLRMAELMLRRYDVVVTNPPYSGKRNLNEKLADYLGDDYPDAKGDLYTAFIQRCSEWVRDTGRLGMIAQQSFMFLSSYEKLRAHLRQRFAIETMAHTGSRAFAEISGEKVNTTVFCLRAESDTVRREKSVGTYFRLVHAPKGDGKRHAFEQGLQSGTNTHLVIQHRLDAIPGSPWTYYAPQSIRELFDGSQTGDVLDARQGLRTADSFRFIRLWWEIGARVHQEADRQGRTKRWFPYTKGGVSKRWNGALDHAVNWRSDGIEIKQHVISRYPYLGGDWGWVVKNTEYYFRAGLTWSTLSTKGFFVRKLPRGFIFDVNGSAGFTRQSLEWPLLAVLNSRLVSFILALLNPSLAYGLGEISAIPLPQMDFGKEPWKQMGVLAGQCYRLTTALEIRGEKRYQFVAPWSWSRDQSRLFSCLKRLADRESRVNDETYRLYGISCEDRALIEAELAGEPHSHGEDQDEPAVKRDRGINEIEISVSSEEVAGYWVSYAVGVALGRFQTGAPSGLGSAVYRREDFAADSLPVPDAAEFDELVGPPERFAYVDDESGRHAFSREVEVALRKLALPDGIAVLDEGHPRDLPTLVERALQLMLGDENAQEVIAEAANGDLRKLLERGFFTKWHFKWYRKRPVYWPLQSAKRSYGFVLFHERVDKNTLYTLQRDYLDIKLNGARQQIADLRVLAEGKTGRARKDLERQIDNGTQILDEVTEFADTMERIVREGYKPEPNWIDDGVILRMAPLWELIPIWWREPKKYWERLQQGQYDWSHIAMNYWPDRVREACRANKSFAIAHEHEEWYQGDL